LAGFLSVFTQLFDLLHDLVKISNQSMDQLHLVGKASDVVASFRGQHHSISSFSVSAQEVAVLGVLHLIILIVM
jgi:hypothetical protein